MDTRTDAERRYDAAALSQPREAAAPDLDTPGAIAVVDALMSQARPDRRDMMLLGLELVTYARSDCPIPDHLNSACFVARYELHRQQQAPEPPSKPDFEDDAPTETVLDDGAQSGVCVERKERPSGDYWLSFSTGPHRPAWLMLDVVMRGDNQYQNGPVDLIIAGCNINETGNEPWTMEQLHKLHTDLGRMLADERVTGAVGEAWAAHDAQS